MLEIKDIYKTFNAGTINEKRALNGVNLNLNPGDFVTIIGGNGAGKSTTLNAIAGVWGIDKGNIIIDGTDITKLSEHKRALFLGRVFQDPMTGTARHLPKFLRSVLIPVRIDTVDDFVFSGCNAVSAVYFPVPFFPDPNRNR